MKTEGPHLSSRVTMVAELYFQDEDRTKVSELLSHECGFGLPLASGDELIERVRLAVLKLSNGNLDSLLSWLEEAKRDWRDVLVAAGFAQDTASARAWATALQPRETEPT